MINNLMLASSFPIWAFILIGAVVILFGMFIALVPVRVWFRCLVSGTYVGIGRLIGMKLRGVNVNLVIDSYINAKKAGLDVTIDELETHALAGGHVDLVVAALISAHSAKINLTNDVAKAIDLAGREVVKAVKESVTPKVIETPMISAVAKDGIELKIIAKVTVRTNLNKLIGGAGEETIISRVGEGIVTTVGSSETHTMVLENPDSISTVVLEKGLDNGTAYQIISIDIADIDVGKNIGAQLKKVAAEAKREIAQSEAEERRAMAIAREQEMKAKVQEMKAIVVEAEAKVPEAMAEAFRNGKIGVMDYYRLKNIEADTTMRNAIGGKGKDEKPEGYGDDEE